MDHLNSSPDSDALSFPESKSVPPAFAGDAPPGDPPPAVPPAPAFPASAFAPPAPLPAALPAVAPPAPPAGDVMLLDPGLPMGLYPGPLAILAADDSLNAFPADFIAF